MSSPIARIIEQQAGLIEKPHAYVDRQGASADVCMVICVGNRPVRYDPAPLLELARHL